MIVVGFGLAWASYTAMFWGWSMVKGYNLTLGQIVSPKPYSGAWPPAAAGAVTASSTSGTSSSTGSSIGSILGITPAQPGVSNANPLTGAQPPTNVNGGSAGQNGPLPPEGSGTE